MLHSRLRQRAKECDCRPIVTWRPKVGTESGERLLSVREAAGRLGLSVSAVRQWVLFRRIGFYKVGRAVRIDPAEIERVLAEGYVPARNANKAHTASGERSGDVAAAGRRAADAATVLSKRR